MVFIGDKSKHNREIVSSQVTVLLTMSPVRLVRLRGHVSWLSTACTGTVIRIAQAETVTSIQWRNDMSRPYTEYTNVVALTPQCTGSQGHFTNQKHIRADASVHILT